MGQALKKRRRRGRKPIQGVTRTKSGRISRSRSAREARERVEFKEAAAQRLNDYKNRIRVRMAHHDLTEAQAARQESGTVLGRLWLTTVIDERQYDAGVKCRQLCADYLKAINAPDATRNGTKGANGDETDAHEQWARDIAERHAAMKQAIVQANIENRESNIPAAIEYIVIRDQEMEHMIGDLRCGLNALVRHFMLDGLSKSRHKGT